MPVVKPTAVSIWNTFRSSGKKHLILTGSRHTGKTTLLNALFPDGCPGITTWAEPRKSVYLKENITGRTALIGTYDPDRPGTENKMRIVSSGFLDLGISVVNNLLASISEWVSIDEIGYLESECSPYCESIEALLAEKHVAAVVRKQNTAFITRMCKREDVLLVDLDDPYGNTGCVIMASGEGKRFGCNKLLANFRGEAMITHIIRSTNSIFTSRVVVTRSREVAELCESMNTTYILHDLPHRSDTVRLGLEAACKTDHCMFCPADQPLLTVDTITSLVMAAKSVPDSIWRPICNDTHGSPVVFPKKYFQNLMELSTGKGGGYVVKQHPESLRTLCIDNPYELMDADTQEDLNILAEL